MRKLLEKAHFLRKKYVQISKSSIQSLMSTSKYMKRIYENMTKTATDSSVTTSKKNGTSKVQRSKSIIIGIGVLLLVLSCAWSSAMIIMATNGWANRVLVFPQLAFVGGMLVYTFVKAFNNNK